ncbi:MAG: hypothetical protein RL341_1250, partial [Pseudomonadota bacterium]
MAQNPHGYCVEQFKKSVQRFYATFLNPPRKLP